MAHSKPQARNLQPIPNLESPTTNRQPPTVLTVSTVPTVSEFRHVYEARREGDKRSALDKLCHVTLAKVEMRALKVP